jgi:hypothetical protein
MVPPSLSSLHEPTVQNKLDLDMVEVLPQGVLLVLLQALLLVGAESPAPLHQISSAHLGVLMTLLVRIAPTRLAQKMLYLQEDLSLVLYLQSQLDARPSWVTLINFESFSKNSEILTQAKVSY